MLTLWIADACVWLAALAQGPAVNEPPPWLTEVLQVWAKEDASAALAQLPAAQPPLAAGQRYAQLAQHLYHQRKDVPAMILAARAGIQFCLDQAEQLPATDERAAVELRGQAKAIAYNLGANCWPGWRDEGITLTATDRAIGLDAARLNLRLAIELKRPAEPLAHAHWLLGAQLLAAQDHEAAAAEFNKSAARFAEAGKATEQQMALGYAALTRRLQMPQSADCQAALAAALATLQKIGTDDAGFFADQIRTAQQALGG